MMLMSPPRIEKTFANKLHYIIPRLQKQRGAIDCGLFAVAFATNSAYGRNT